VYRDIGVRVREVYVLQKISHSHNSLVVGLDNGRGFFCGFEVSTLDSGVMIVFIFLLQPCYFLTLTSIVIFDSLLLLHENKIKSALFYFGQKKK